MNKPFISIIVPVYNVEKYLSTCIDSILKQTYPNFELLLINDGSLDRSGIICEEYVHKDNRVSVIHKENGGVSSARNLGLENVKGEWVIFVDADDTIAIGFFEEIIKIQNIHPADLTYFSYNIMSDCEPITKNIIHRKAYYTRNEIGIGFQKSSTILDMGVPWGKVFKNKIIQENKIRFNTNLSISEDRLFTYNYMKFVSSVYVHDFIAYNYRILPNSLSKNNKSEKDLVYRCQSLYEAALKLKIEYNLDFDDFFPLLRYHIYFINSIFQESTVKTQKIAEKWKLWNNLKGYNFYYDAPNKGFKLLYNLLKKVGILNTCLITQHFHVYLFFSTIKSLIRK